MAMSCDNDITMGSCEQADFEILLGGSKLEEIKTNDLTIIRPWYDHNLLTYIFCAHVM